MVTKDDWKEFETLLEWCFTGLIAFAAFVGIIALLYCLYLTVNLWAKGRWKRRIITNNMQKEPEGIELESQASTL